MQKIKNQISRFCLSFFMSYLTNYGVMFHGSDFDRGLGWFGFFISLFLYFFISKYVLKYYNKFVFEQITKVLKNKKESDLFFKTSDNNSFFCNIILILGTIILLTISLIYLSLFLNEDNLKYYYLIPKINLIGLIMTLTIFLITFFIWHNINIKKTKVTNNIYYSLIFTGSFIFYVVLSFIFVKLIVEFITTFIAVAGGGPFGPA